jgi:hypothetical protein
MPQLLQAIPYHIGDSPLVGRQRSFATDLKLFASTRHTLLDSGSTG